MIEDEATALYDGDRIHRRDTNQLFRIEPTEHNQLRCDGGHVRQTPAVTRRCHEIKQGHLGSRHAHRPGRGIHDDDRTVRSTHVLDELQHHATKRTVPHADVGDDLEYLRALMRRSVQLCGRQQPDVVRMVELHHQAVDEVCCRDRSPRSVLRRNRNVGTASRGEDLPLLP